MPIQYPALKESADRASNWSQGVFLFLNVLQLTLLGVMAFVSGWNPTSPERQRLVAIAFFGLMLLALGLVSALRQGRFEHRWFRCRAFAEGIKGAVWYFVMSPQAEAGPREAEYLERVRQLRERLEDVAREIVLHGEGPEITDWMRKSQALPFDQKLALYLEHRLKDQLNWYRAKAAFNVKRERRWFWIIFAIEFVALGYAALQAWRLWELNAVGGIAAAAAGLIAWTQIKRFSDLGTSYAIAAGDLRRIADTHGHVASEAELQQLVQEVETAVSREHSMWLARRMV